MVAAAAFSVGKVGSNPPVCLVSVNLSAVVAAAVVVVVVVVVGT